MRNALRAPVASHMHLAFQISLARVSMAALHALIMNSPCILHRSLPGGLPSMAPLSSEHTSAFVAGGRPYELPWMLPCS